MCCWAFAQSSSSSSPSTTRPHTQLMRFTAVKRKWWCPEQAMCRALRLTVLLCATGRKQSDSGVNNPESYKASRPDIGVTLGLYSLATPALEDGTTSVDELPGSAYRSTGAS